MLADTRARKEEQDAGVNIESLRIFKLLLTLCRGRKDKGYVRLYIYMYIVVYI